MTVDWSGWAGYGCRSRTPQLCQASGAGHHVRPPRTDIGARGVGEEVRPGACGQGHQWGPAHPSHRSQLPCHPLCSGALLLGVLVTCTRTLKREEPCGRMHGLERNKSSRGHEEDSGGRERARVAAPCQFRRDVGVICLHSLAAATPPSLKEGGATKKQMNRK